MRIFSGITLAFCFLIALSACGPEERQPKDSIPMGGPTFEPDTTLRSNLDYFDSLYAQRAKSGDTIPGRHQKLVEMLPTELNGYSLEINEGNSFFTEDFSFSEATNVFYKDEEGEEYVAFQVGDYSADRRVMRNLLQRYNIADGVELEGVIEKRLPGQGNRIFAWTHFNQETGFARLEAGIDYRIHVKIEATRQTGTDLVKQCWEMVKK